MTVITDVSTTWSAPLTLSTDEVWQVRLGDAYLTTTEPPETDGGLYLHQMQAVQFSSGTVVRYRIGLGNAATIVREAV